MEYQELEENKQESTSELREHIKKRCRVTACVILGVGGVLMMFGALAEGRIEDESPAICFNVGLSLSLIGLLWNGMLLGDRPQQSTSTNFFTQQNNPHQKRDGGNTPSPA